MTEYRTPEGVRYERNRFLEPCTAFGIACSECSDCKEERLDREARDRESRSRGDDDYENYDTDEECDVCNALDRQIQRIQTDPSTKPEWDELNTLMYRIGGYPDISMQTPTYLPGGRTRYNDHAWLAEEMPRWRAKRDAYYNLYDRIKTRTNIVNSIPALMEKPFFLKEITDPRIKELVTEKIIKKLRELPEPEFEAEVRKAVVKYPQKYEGTPLLPEDNPISIYENMVIERGLSPRLLLPPDSGWHGTEGGKRTRRTRRKPTKLRQIQKRKLRSRK